MQLEWVLFTCKGLCRHNSLGGTERVLHGTPIVDNFKIHDIYVYSPNSVSDGIFLSPTSGINKLLLQ